ncbi:MAG TPA: FecR domain-containing protein [Prolixibacteraceae bacterium]|nr:FecR domain-containing protein [Prolixibacteraceae bacterium]
MPEEDFHKILNNLANEAEKKDFFNLLKDDSEKQEEFRHYKNLYVLSNLNPDRYRKQQHDNFNKFWNTIQQKKSKSIFSHWMHYAAIIIAALVLGFLTDHVINNEGSVVFAQHIEYSSDKGSVSTIHLEDGSAIWLSSGTTLILNTNQQGETLAQLNGEAYFDLIPDPKRKFTVDLGQFKVRDIGTQFNIRAYKSEQSITVALVEGQIDLINKSEKSFLTVKPGDFVLYNKSDHEITVNQQDQSIIGAWKDGKFVFIDKSLSEICNELENWYNIEIQIEDQKLANTRYTSVVKRSTTVQMVLKILAVTDQIHYEIIENKEGKDIIKIRK